MVKFEGTDPGSTTLQLPGRQTQAFHLLLLVFNKQLDI